jgi:hypothetical protein
MMVVSPFRLPVMLQRTTELQGKGHLVLMPVMQIRPVGMFMLHRLVPVGM